MHCILVFDHLNDIIFSKCDKKFIRHIKKLGRVQGFQHSDCGENDDFDSNLVIQLFSPIVTSQRVMSSQFGNSYTSIQCQDGTNMVFDEYMGYLFIHIGCDDINYLKRVLGICIATVQHLCGPDVSVLRETGGRREVVCRVLDTWAELAAEEQAVLVEAVEQLTVNTELSAAAIDLLRDATDRVKSLLDFPKSHALIFVHNKFLALYSSRSARELSAGDIMFLGLLSGTLRGPPLPQEPPPGLQDSSLSSEEFYSPDSSPQLSLKSNNSVKRGENGRSCCGMQSEIVLLSGGSAGYPAVIPHVVHISTLSEGVTLLLLYQIWEESLSVSLYESISAGSKVCGASGGEMSATKKGMEELEGAMKRLLDSARKLKQQELIVKAVHAKWDMLKKQWKEERSASVGASCASLVSSLQELTCSTLLDLEILTRAIPPALSIAHTVAASLNDFAEFLKVKALRNFTLGSTSLSINKYLEEFPGLVHFLYIDRTNHRVTAPSLDFKSQQTVALTKKKIWSMVEFSRGHLQEGHLAVMWKDTTFNYAYCLWFQDSQGAPLKPKVNPTLAVKSLPIPGVLSGDFYQKLCEMCFPKMGAGKVRCLELYCIHLGLATSSCVLEHSRRLAATIWEVTGLPNNPLDLL